MEKGAKKQAKTFQDLTVQQRIEPRMLLLVQEEKALALVKAGRRKEAKAAMSLPLDAVGKALEAHPDNNRLWWIKASMHYELGEYEKALSAYEKVSLTGKESVQLWYSKANVLRRLGRHEEANNAYDIADGRNSG